MDSPFSIAALCAGGGGLERAVGLCVPDARVVVYVEGEAFACEVLATAHETLGVGEALLWPDLRTFDGKPWAGVVDCITSGMPCQPHSVAGKRLGAADERNLWPGTARVIREVGPGVVFLENVAGSVPFFGTVVVPELEGMGYAVEAGLFEAAEVGCPMRGARLFVLAAAPGEGLQGCDTTALEHLGVAPKPVAGTWPPGPGEVREIPRMADELASRADCLRLLGNGVCEAQAAWAFVNLLARLEGRVNA